MNYLARLKNLKTPSQGSAESAKNSSGTFGTSSPGHISKIGTKNTHIEGRDKVVSVTFGTSSLGHIPNFETLHDQGTRVLTRLADQYQHPLGDLLDWYGDTVGEFATEPYAAELVQCYIEHREIYWQSIYLEFGRRPVTSIPPTNGTIPLIEQGKPALHVKGKPLVTCETCTHFIHNPHSKAGIGECRTQGEGSVQPVNQGQWHGKPKPPLYPLIERECKHHEIVFRPMTARNIDPHLEAVEQVHGATNR